MQSFITPTTTARRILFSFPLYFILFFAIAFIAMSKNEFDDVNVNQILFHIELLKDNVVTMTPAYIIVFFWNCKNAFILALIISFLREIHPALHNSKSYKKLTVFLLILAIISAKTTDALFGLHRGGIDPVDIAYLFEIFMLLFLLFSQSILSFRPVYITIRNGIRKLTGKVIYSISVMAVLLYGANYIHLYSFIKGEIATTDFFTTDAYINPSKVTISGSGNKNLLIIYAESIEENFGDAKFAGKDYLASLRDPKDILFHLDQMPGTDFTIGGIVSSQCGIPLKSISILSGNLTGESMENFLPNAICLGDVLKANGYYNVYYNGSSGIFSGMKKFFRQHGYEEFMAKEEWLEKKLFSEEKMNMWAIYDSDLIELAIKRLDELMEKGKKFSFALSTMDTHEPGFVSPVCEEKGGHWASCIQCSTDQIAKLIRHISDKGWEDKFVILITGDHLSRKPEIDGYNLKDVSPRYVFCDIKGARLIPARNIITHFDLFPTILSALGFTVEGGRLGFGFDAFNQENSPPENSHEQLKKNILNHSKTYQDLWLK